MNDLEVEMPESGSRRGQYPIELSAVCRPLDGDGGDLVWTVRKQPLTEVRGFLLW